MSGNAIALAVIAVLVVVVIYQYWKANHVTTTTFVPPNTPSSVGGSGGNMSNVSTRTRDDPYGAWASYPPYDAPWTSLAARSQKAPVRRWPNSNMSQRGLAQSGVDPDRIADAEREAWYAADANVEKFATDPSAANQSADPVIAGDVGGLDYTRYTTDLIVDPRMRENHRKWVEEMGPWSGALRNVDNLDEALEASTNFVGLQRPQAVPVYNPTQVTELGPDIFAGNHKFRFNG